MPTIQAVAFPRVLPPMFLRFNILDMIEILLNIAYNPNADKPSSLPHHANSKSIDVHVGGYRSIMP